MRDTVKSVVRQGRNFASRRALHESSVTPRGLGRDATPQNRNGESGLPQPAAAGAEA
jgi:hypothetical protein